MAIKELVIHAAAKLPDVMVADAMLLPATVPEANSVVVIEPAKILLLPLQVNNISVISLLAAVSSAVPHTLFLKCFEWPDATSLNPYPVPSPIRYMYSLLSF